MRSYKHSFTTNANEPETKGGTFPNFEIHVSIANIIQSFINSRKYSWILMNFMNTDKYSDYGGLWGANVKYHAILGRKIRTKGETFGIGEESFGGGNRFKECNVFRSCINQQKTENTQHNFCNQCSGRSVTAFWKKKNNYWTSMQDKDNFSSTHESTKTRRSQDGDRDGNPFSKSRRSTRTHVKEKRKLISCCHLWRRWRWKCKGWK